MKASGFRASTSSVTICVLHSARSANEGTEQELARLVAAVVALLGRSRGPSSRGGG